MQKLLIATRNKGKFDEILEVIGDLPLEAVFLGELDVDDGDFAEDGETFAENALKKAQFFGDRLGMLAMGEDSGIVVDALSGELGVKTRRWGAGEKASDEEWIQYFLERMRDEPVRTAKFVCHSSIYDGVSGRELSSFSGETRGILTEDLRAPIIPGLPLSSCFVPEGFEKTYAELGIEKKNQISHRWKSMAQMRDFLSNFLGDQEAGAQV